MERSRAIRELRDGGEDPGGGRIGAEIAGLISRMTSPDRASRPSASDLLEAAFSSHAGRRRELEATVEELRRVVEEQREALSQKDREIAELRRRLIDRE